MLQALLGHTHRRLTSASLGRYLLESSGHGHLLDPGSNGTVLMLGSHGHPDYSRDMVLHGETNKRN